MTRKKVIATRQGKKEKIQANILKLKEIQKYLDFLKIAKVFILMIFYINFL